MFDCQEKINPCGAGFFDLICLNNALTEASLYGLTLLGDFQVKNKSKVRHVERVYL